MRTALRASAAACRGSKRWSKLRFQPSPLRGYDAWPLMADLCTATTSAIASSSRVGVWAGTALLASFVLCANATAASTQYAVDGLTVGTKLNFDKASYRDYKCSPSDQFDGLTWCQITRTGRKRRASYSPTYSILHSPERDILYVNRSQEPASFNRTEAENEIQRHSRDIGESPRILKMPHRSGLPDGLIAVWGEITLEQLDRESIKILADGKGPKKGLLIDFLGNFVRSAKEGLPIYRIDGGPGLIFGASFGRKGGGTLRLAAVDASGLRSAPRVEQSTTQFTAHNAKAETNQPELGQTVENLKTEIALATVTTQLTADKAEAESNPPELGQTIEKLKTEIALATTKITELEKATATAEAARIKAAKASDVAETAKREIERTSTTVKSELEATMAQLNADRAVAADAGTNRWENTLPGAIGGLFVVLTASIVGFFVDRRKMIASKLGTNPIDLSAQHQNSEAETVPYAGAIVAFERELEQQVAAINAKH